jgi:predicted nucleic acid-binding protein
MTDFVVDANILMSILISGKASYRPILSYYNFVFPDYVLIEADKYQSMMFAKTKMQKEEFLQWSYFVFSNVTILPRYVLNSDVIEKSNKIVENIDPKDVSYVALAMQLDLVLLTRDAVLYTGLKKQGFRRVLLFEDFLRGI